MDRYNCSQQRLWFIALQGLGIFPILEMNKTTWMVSALRRQTIADTVVGNLRMSQNIIVIYPKYFLAFLQMASVTVLISIVQFFFWDKANYWLMLVIFSATFLLFNRFWIRKYSFDKNRAHLVINYPLAVFGEREQMIEFKSIRKAEYYPYMYRSPSHLNIYSGNKKFRINCSKKSAIRIGECLAIYGVHIKFTDESEERHRKMPKY